MKLNQYSRHNFNSVAEGILNLPKVRSNAKHAIKSRPDSKFILIKNYTEFYVLSLRNPDKTNQEIEQIFNNNLDIIIEAGYDTSSSSRNLPGTRLRLLDLDYSIIANGSALRELLIGHDIHESISSDISAFKNLSKCINEVFAIV